METSRSTRRIRVFMKSFSSEEAIISTLILGHLISILSFASVNPTIKWQIIVQRCAYLIQA